MITKVALKGPIQPSSSRRKHTLPLLVREQEALAIDPSAEPGDETEEMQNHKDWEQRHDHATLGICGTERTFSIVAAGRNPGEVALRSRVPAPTRSDCTITCA